MTKVERRSDFITKKKQTIHLRGTFGVSSVGICSSIIYLTNSVSHVDAVICGTILYHMSVCRAC